MVGKNRYWAGRRGKIARGQESNVGSAANHLFDRAAELEARRAAGSDDRVLRQGRLRGPRRAPEDRHGRGAPAVPQGRLRGAAAGARARLRSGSQGVARRVRGALRGTDARPAARRRLPGAAREPRVAQHEHPGRDRTPDALRPAGRPDLRRARARPARPPAPGGRGRRRVRARAEPPGLADAAGGAGIPHRLGTRLRHRDGPGTGARRAAQGPRVRTDRLPARRARQEGGGAARKAAEAGPVL